MLCGVCGSENTKLFFSGYPGYVEGTIYDIFSCIYCGSNFISTKNVGKKVYELIYSTKETPGYDRYYRYAHEIKACPNPLKFLSESEITYFPVSEFLKGKQGLNILEIGCSYGYLTYAMRKCGNIAIGIDVSKSAIDFATKNFGGKFYCTDETSFSKNNKQKFDLIVATEVIEHVAEIKNFLGACIRMLKNGGSIILTTPNKDYFSKRVIWQTDPPPVHTTFITKRGIENIARQHNLDFSFTKFSGYSSKRENSLITFFLTRKETIMPSIILRNGKPNPARSEPYSSPVWNLLRLILIDFFPIRYLCDAIHSFFAKKWRIIGVVLRKG